MKNKDLGTVEFLIFLIKLFFSSIFHYLLCFDPIFGNCLFLIWGGVEVEFFAVQLS